MASRLPLKLGSSDQRGDNVTGWQKWAKAYAKSYADILGPVDGYYGESDAAFTREMQRRLGLPQTGIFDENTAARVGYSGASASPRRKIWIYTAPGSGAPWWIGPSFTLGEWCKDVLKLNHQPVGYPIGGYLGLMGGDPGLSYNEVIEAQGLSLERLLGENPDINDPDLELWFSGYSQSADGMEDAVVRLFGDGGKYAHLRPRINGLIQFGNPSKKGTGIARKVRPPWLYALVRNVTTKGDFYAEATDEIRPLFYAEIVRAETSLSFAGHIAKIIVPVLINLVGGLFGISGLLAGGGALSVAMADADQHDHEDVDRKLIELLSIKGILTNIPALIGLLAALPGIQTHGLYHVPRPEFQGRTGIQVACDTIAAFRR
ncbi:peptidoglycan-binding domain-containing protein [Mycolicibacterium gilvum]|uniref:peptidoglycan-binding domain-containing protein n=1 Tax=Mycolicibacterium gilvum TaxID=1804 RepID=UPI004045D809